MMEPNADIRKAILIVEGDTNIVFILLRRMFICRSAARKN